MGKWHELVVAAGLVALAGCPGDDARWRRNRDGDGVR